MLTPQQYAEKWASRFGASGESYKQGIMAVQQSPTELAANAQDRYVAGVNAAVQSGKWQRGLRSVTREAWQTASVNKGAPRLSLGAQEAKGKVLAVAQRLLPFIQQTVSNLPPRGGLQENINRAVAMMTNMAQFSKNA